MSNAIIVIPVYESDISAYKKVSLFQCCKILNKYEISLVCPNGLDVGAYEKILKQYNINYNIKRFNRSNFVSVFSYSELLLGKEFYQHFSTYEFMLIYQLDAFVFNDELEYWCEQGFDYIGAPWFENYDASNDNSKMLDVAGNGGFSLRKISSFIRILSADGEPQNVIREYMDQHRNEDGFFSQSAPSLDKSFKVAPPEVAMFFSFECLPKRLYEMTNGKLPFGCHAWDKYELEFWRSFINLSQLNEESKKNIKFSIIICTFNVVNRLPKTLDSILQQSYDDYEVIIIDGASTDGTLKVIEKYAQKFEGKLRWISEKDTGIYNAMNKGVSMASGEYLNVVGAGDWLEKDSLEKANKCIEENIQTSAVYGKTRVWEKDLSAQQVVQTHPGVLPIQPLQHPSMFYKKKLHEIYGLYDESYRIAADYAFCLKVFYHGKEETKAFDFIVDNFVMDGLSSTRVDECKEETLRAQKEAGFEKSSTKIKIVNYIKKVMKL